MDALALKFLSLSPALLIGPGILSWLIGWAVGAFRKASRQTKTEVVSGNVTRQQTGRQQGGLLQSFENFFTVLGFGLILLGITLFMVQVARTVDAGQAAAQ